MLQSSLRAPVTKIVTPICRGLLRVGITANWMTFIGTLASVITAILLIPSGHLFAGCLTLTAFVLFDALDGTMARLSPQGANNWGALLDSTLDRISDGALLGALLWYLHNKHQTLELIVLLNILFGFLISYIKARAESLDINCDGGLAERTERLIITLVSIGFAGLGTPYILEVGMWLLLLASVFTVYQRFKMVYQAAK
jgi:CDP-diacylglycerol---glycerol-3-phosphate 3-phosphatidyltransferase